MTQNAEFVSHPWRTRIQAEIVVFRITEELIENEWQEVDCDVAFEEDFAQALASTPSEELIFSLVGDIWEYALNRAKEVEVQPTGQ